jgi:hypothetical protein
VSSTDHRTDQTSLRTPLIDGLWIFAAGLVLSLALFALVALLAPSSARSASPHPCKALRGTGVPYWKCETHYHARLVRKLQSVDRTPPVWYALKLASAAFGVPFWELHSVGSCESHLWPYAQNGAYRGLFQTGPMFERGPFGQAGFSVWDPLANAMTAAYTVARGGWSQWECKP